MLRYSTDTSINCRTCSRHYHKPKFCMLVRRAQDHKKIGKERCFESFREASRRRFLVASRRLFEKCQVLAQSVEMEIGRGRSRFYPGSEGNA